MELAAGSPGRLEAERVVRTFYREVGPALHRRAAFVLASKGLGASECEERGHEIVDAALTDFVRRRVRDLRPAATPEQDRRVAWSYLSLSVSRSALRHRVGRLHVATGERLDRVPALDDLASRDGALGRRLLDCLDKLRPSPDSRRFLNLVYGSDLSHAEAAEVVAKSPQYVGRIVAKALGQLRKCLATAPASDRGGSMP